MRSRSARQSLQLASSEYFLDVSKRLLRRFIAEVLTGFDAASASYGKDGVAGNLHPVGRDMASAGVRPQAHSNVLDDEDSDQQAADQDAKHAACCLIRGHDGTFLAVSRKDDPSAFGFPGGKVDPGEKPIEAAARELQEETGLTAKKLHPVFTMRDEGGYVTHTFACEVDGQINTDEEGVIRWVKPEVLTSSTTSPFSPYNKALFDHLGIKYS